MPRIRRVFFAGATALAMSVMVLSASVSAASAKQGTGSVNCQMTGSVVFTPALTTTAAPVTIKVTGKLINCGGSGDGANVTGGRFFGTISSTAMSCNSGTYSTSGTLKSSYIVKTGTPTLTPSTISFVSIQIQAGTPPPIAAQITGAVTAGSFFTDGEFGNVVSNQGTACSAKWRFTGVPTVSTYSLG